MQKLENTVETGISQRLQPWQSLFAILTYAIGVYGLDNERALILYGLILAALGFVMVSSYKHKEAVKEIVAPWLVEQLLNTVSEYLGTPPTPEEINGEIVVKTPDLKIEATAKDMKAELRAQIKTLEAALNNGKSDSS